MAAASTWSYGQARRACECSAADEAAQHGAVALVRSFGSGERLGSENRWLEAWLSPSSAAHTPLFIAATCCGHRSTSVEALLVQAGRLTDMNLDGMRCAAHGVELSDELHRHGGGRWLSDAMTGKFAISSYFPI